MLELRQVVPERWWFAKQCPQLGTPKTHAPLVPQAQAGPTHYPPVMGSRFPSKLGLQAPAPKSRTECGAWTSTQKTTLKVSPKRARTHDKRVISLLCTHTQVCAQDNKSVTCLDGLCNDRSLTDTDRENSVTKPCPASTGNTTSYTHQYPNHIPA